MALKADNSNLPRAASDGNPPDSSPRFGQLLAEAWDAMNDERYHEKSRTDVDRYVRLGWAGQCARLIGYRLLGVPESNPPDLAAEWRMGLGTMVHELLQDAVRKAFPGADVEKIVGAESDAEFGFPVSGRSDLFLVTGSTGATGGHQAFRPIARLPKPETMADAVQILTSPLGEFGETVAPARPPGEVTTKRTVVEIKTVNGFGFKVMVGARGAPEGPRSGALFQAALNGRAHHADEVVVLVLSLECLSDRELESLVKKQGGEPDPWRKFCGEWTYSAADLDEMVDRELVRLGKIVTMVDEHSMAAENPLPPRSVPLELPQRARITDPTRGTWQTEIEGNVLDAGTYWGCAYCSHQDRCAADGPS